MSAKITDISKAPAMRRKIVDECGRLAAWYKRAKPKVDRFAEMKKSISGWAAAEHAASDEATYNGRSHTATVSAADFQREIVNMQGVYERMGHEAFIAHCAVAFKVLDIFVAPDDAIGAGLVKKERTGSRSVIVQPREPKQEAA